MEDRIFGSHHSQQVWKTTDQLLLYLKKQTTGQMASYQVKE
jgi:hypothetical protein